MQELEDPSINKNIIISIKIAGVALNILKDFILVRNIKSLMSHSSLRMNTLNERGTIHYEETIRISDTKSKVETIVSFLRKFSIWALDCILKTDKIWLSQNQSKNWWTILVSKLPIMIVNNLITPPKSNRVKPKNNVGKVPLPPRRGNVSSNSK